jgi:ankyrin repeat protein
MNIMSLTSLLFTETRQITNIINNIRNGDLFKIKSQINSYSVNRSIDATGNTALHYAIMFKQYDIILHLLSIGADEHIQNLSGDSCRILACRYYSLEFFDAKNSNTINLRSTISKQANDILTLKDSLVEWKSYYDKLNKKHIILTEENNELKVENNKLKRKNSFLQDSYDQLLKKNKTKR